MFQYVTIMALDKSSVIAFRSCWLYGVFLMFFLFLSHLFFSICKTLWTDVLLKCCMQPDGLKFVKITACFFKHFTIWFEPNSEGYSAIYKLICDLKHSWIVIDLVAWSPCSKEVHGSKPSLELTLDCSSLGTKLITSVLFYTRLEKVMALPSVRSILERAIVITTAVIYSCVCSPYLW